MIKDFLGHELAVGDIVICAYSGDLFYERIVSFEGKSVKTMEIGAKPGSYTINSGRQVIWHSSEYRDAPYSYIVEVCKPKAANR